MAAVSSNSQSSTTNNNPPPPPPVVKQEHTPPQDVSSEKMESKEVKEDSKDVKKEPKDDEPICNMDEKARIEKFKKYEADFKQYLMSKYFSDKTVFGGNIFDTRTTIDGQTATASRLPPYQSFLDPATFEKLVSKDSGETPTTSNSDKKPST